jgi:AMMECR1 domain-containing protein/orotate phosphoribosyltransferase
MRTMREDRKSILASMPASFQADRAELLALLLKKGILYSSPTEPIRSPDGRTGRWMLNSLGFTLEQHGAELAARCLLPLLERFDGRQLATYGLIGVPILQSCILQSGGRYRGLLVRKEAKAHGAMRVIEGEIDPFEPVILVDDSIASGNSFWKGCEHLEKEGLRVEGGVCLVHFGWEFGIADAMERGFHMEALFDLYEDLMPNIKGELKPVPNPSQAFPPFNWSGAQAPEGLHPAHLARLALLEYLTTGTLLRPPIRMDRTYDSSGGAWVSIRSRSNIHVRHARDGFWRFPGEQQWTAPEHVLRAALLTAQHLPKGSEGRILVDSSHIAVTLFSELEECTVGQLDNDRYGIVVGSRERAGVMGGALPRMPGISGEFHQFQHARIANGKLRPFEPFVIHRHGVMKYVEPEAPWQPTGVPLPASPLPCDDPEICLPIAIRARDIAIAHVLGLPEATEPLPGSVLPHGINFLFVTIYIWGRFRGCMGRDAASLADDQHLRALVLEALEDERFEHVEASSPEAISVSISLLSNGSKLGEVKPGEIMRYVVMGRQTLQVSQGKRSGALLPFWAARESISREQYPLEVIDKAGITRPPYSWERFDCKTWLADAEGAGEMEGAFRRLREDREGRELLVHLAGLYSNYLLKHQREDGTFYESYEPFRNRLRNGGNLPWMAHATWVLARASRTLRDPLLQAAAEKTLAFLLRSMKLSAMGVWLEMGQSLPSVSEITFLVLALCQLPRGDYRRPQVRGLAETLWSAIGRHGHIFTHRGRAEVDDGFQNYCPGQVLLALATAAEARLTDVDSEKLDRAFRYYRHRFRYFRDFGQASWLMQAFSAWSRIQRNPQFFDLVFEIGDWLLQWQQEKSGAFINDHQAETPGYTTALYLEGIGAAIHLMDFTDSGNRRQQYLDAYWNGLRFLNRITIQPAHTWVLPNSDYAIGGLRLSLNSSYVRIDFVQHGLSSLLELYEHFTDAGTSRQPSMKAPEPISDNTQAVS